MQTPSFSAVGLSHRNPTDGSNNTDYFNKTLVQQGLGSILDEVHFRAGRPLLCNNRTQPYCHPPPHPPLQVQHIDTWTGRQFGLVASGQPASAFQRANATTLSSTQAASAYDFVLSATTNQTATSQIWVGQALATHASALATTHDQAWAGQVAHWQSFWNRSHIDIGAANGTGAEDGATISAQYARTRYLQAIQSGTLWPIKFNGQVRVCCYVRAVRVALNAVTAACRVTHRRFPLLFSFSSPTWDP